MIYHDARIILDLPELFDEKILKQHYYLKALKYHPDKNHDIDANKQFQEVLEAYNYLRDHSSFKCDNDFSYSSLSDDNNDHSNYLYIFENFISGIDKNIDISKLLSIINNNYTEFSLKLLKQLPKNILLSLHKFVNQNADILHINMAISTELDKLIAQHTQDDSIVIVNPTIDNLLNDDAYKLQFNGETYFIPLWHHELVYDTSGQSLIVQCEPVLPDYINLDQYNNIYVALSINLSSIFKKEYLDLNIGLKTYKIPVAELYMRKHQRYTIKKTGISLINTRDIYNINERANIVVDIHTIL